MILFGLQVAQVKGISNQTMSEYITELEQLPDEIDSVLKNYQQEAQDVAKKYATYDHALYLGRDTAYPAALEGSLKLKEISYIHADGYPTGELKHGTLALVDDRFFEVFLILDDWLFEKSISGVSEVNARGGHILAITNSDKEIEAETVVYIKTKAKLLAPLVLNVFQQLFAYHVAVAKGNNVDQPRNLAKSVTVE
jgi:glucosamine--fructose-6-phosphate aminotransferase (isomerizing)